MRFLLSRCTAPGALAVLLVLSCAAGCYCAANPPICPFVIGWNGTIAAWAQGCPWVKVLYAQDISPAKSTGAKVFYRPWDADSTYHDDGCLPADRTGAQFADMVWAKISNLSKKPDAVGYRNEFNWDNPTSSKRTCAEFLNFANRLRSLGYTGKIIFGSFGVGWVDSSIWNDADLKNAVLASDGVETHEYFDLTVNCCAPWLCFRHRDIAIKNHAYLQSKDWYIGEFGSDRVCGNCTYCDDDLCRRGWQDSGKLTAQQYVDQLKVYRAGCASQVVAVFVFQVGSPGWADFEVLGTPAADYMRTTWGLPTGAFAGTVKSATGTTLGGAIVNVSPGDRTAVSGSDGTYAINSVPIGGYDLTAKMTGYGWQTRYARTVYEGQTTTVDFSLIAITPISTAKGLTDGTTVLVSGIVTALFPIEGSQESIYIEDADRTCGIGVSTTRPVALGDEVQVSGTMAISGGEKSINAGSVLVVRSGLPLPAPLGMSNRSLGGGKFGRQPAVLDYAPNSRFATGLSNIGLLVRTWGKVTHIDPAGAHFYVNDGTAIADGSGQAGVRVACSGLTLPQVGDFLVVTGVSGTTVVGGKVVRLLRPRSANDLQRIP